jgi:hypothetical protein
MAYSDLSAASRAFLLLIISFIEIQKEWKNTNLYAQPKELSFFDCI